MSIVAEILMNGLMDAHDVAKVLRCDVSFVHRERRVGALQSSVKLGNGEKGWRYTEKDVQAYLADKLVKKFDLDDEPAPQFIPVGAGSYGKQKKLRLLSINQ